VWRMYIFFKEKDILFNLIRDYPKSFILSYLEMFLLYDLVPQCFCD
jgi:hypothetical protein